MVDTNQVVYDDSVANDQASTQFQKGIGYLSPAFKWPLGAVPYKIVEGGGRIEVIPYIITSPMNPMVREGKVKLGGDKIALSSYIELPIHSYVGPGKKTFACLSYFGKRCPICEMAKVLIQKGHPDAKALRPKERTFFNVMKGNDPTSTEILVYDVSVFLWRNPISAILQGMRANPLDPAYNYLSRRGPGVSFMVRQKSTGTGSFLEPMQFSFVPRVHEVTDALIKRAYDLDALLIEPDPEEMKAALCMGGDDDEGYESYEEPTDDQMYERSEPCGEEEISGREHGKRIHVGDVSNVDVRKETMLGNSTQQGNSGVQCPHNMSIASESELCRNCKQLFRCVSTHKSVKGLS